MIERHDSLKVQTYNTIREMIISQQLQFGEKISIAGLSRELQVSNSPIREAVSMLESDGLVVNNPNVGPSVVKLSKELFYTLTHTVTVLLTGSYMECIAMRASDQLADMLAERLSRQKELYAKGLTLEYAAHAITFDRSFVDVCNNRLLSKMFASSFDLLMLATFYIHQRRPQATADNLIEHEQLFEAVKAREHDLVYRLITEHIREQEYIEPLY